MTKGLASRRLDGEGEGGLDRSAGGGGFVGVARPGAPESPRGCAPGDAVLVARRDDRVVVAVNAAFARLTGRGVGDLTGRTLDDIGVRTPEEPSLSWTSDQQDGARDLTATVLTDSGATLSIEVTAEVLHDGVQDLILMSVRPPPVAVELEDQVRLTEEQYREIFEDAIVGIARVRADGDLIAVNRAWAAVLGYDSPPTYVREVGNAAAIYVDPRDRRTMLAEVERTGYVRGYEARLKHRSGRHVWVKLDVRGVRDDDGTLVELHASGVDITASKEAAEQLLRSERRFRSIFESSLDGVLLLDLSDRIVSANAAAAQMLGLEPHALQGLRLSDLVENSLPSGFSPPQPSATCQPDPAAALPLQELRLRRSDGSLFRAEATCSAFDDSTDGRLRSMIVRDVTEREQAQQALRLALERADAGTRAKNEFLSRVSHELRTPMNAVMGFAQLLELNLTGSSRGHATQIRRAGEHLLQLINELLDISRIESGDVSLSTEPVVIEEVVREVVELMAPLAQRAEVEVVVTAPPEAFAVRADRQRLRQVLLNLIGNAIKYNRRGGHAHISWDAHRQDLLRLAVRDTGRGIPADQMHRLFTPFDRLDADSTTEGTGVGLALSLRLTQAMDGQLLVESEPGVGSTFTLVLPATEPAVAGIGTRNGCGADVSLLAGWEGAGEDCPEKATVLYIEDNPANRSLIEHLVRRHRPSWEVATAITGEAGTTAAAAIHPDVILLDLHLPDTTGLEVLRQLKATPATAEVPVVIISADAGPGQVALLTAEGADRYLTKPIDVSEILDVLDAVRAGHPLGGDPI